MAGAAAEPAPAAQPAPAAAPPPPAAPGAQKAGAAGAKKLEQVLEAAREKLYPRCSFCPECDGQACAGEVPGLGGIGSGMSFRNNVTALQKVRLKLRALHDVARPDLTTALFGTRLEAPILCAALGGTTYNMGGKISEEEFIEALLGGAKAVGTVGLVADGAEDPLETYKVRLAAVARNRGIAVIKPRAQKDIVERMRLVEGSATGPTCSRCSRSARTPCWSVDPSCAARTAAARRA
jgi:hypothetical protein